MIGTALEIKTIKHVNLFIDLSKKMYFSHEGSSRIGLPCKYPDGVSVRAIRGAIQVRDNSAQALNNAVPRLLQTIFEENGISFENAISILFTATPDLNADFPAAAARTLPIGDIPLICASEIDVPGALSRVVRVLIHVETTLSKQAIKHVYLDGAEVLRKDLAQ